MQIYYSVRIVRGILEIEIMTEVKKQLDVDVDAAHIPSSKENVYSIVYLISDTCYMCKMHTPHVVCCKFLYDFLVEIWGQSFFVFYNF